MKSRFNRSIIFVAEDDSAMRGSLCTDLRKSGYAVVESSNGLELVERVKHGYRVDEPPALIVSDVRMPVMSGLAALTEIRSWGSRIPIILLTALGTDDMLDQAFRLGATAVLIKPLEFADLRTAIECFVRG